jgi:hypothetical protein
VHSWRYKAGIAAGAFLLFRATDSLLDSYGLMSHEVESTITAEPNWLVGEIKTCYSFDPEGVTLGRIDCDTGHSGVSDRRMKITFYGREKQPEYEVVTWNCTRTEKSFTCLELSGLDKLAGAATGDTALSEASK